MYGRFAGPKKSGRNNEVVVRRGSTVLLLYIVQSLASCQLFANAFLHVSGPAEREGLGGGFSPPPLFLKII